MINWNFINDYQDKIPPWGPVGYIVYKRTYARITDDGLIEEWWQTIYRCLRSLVDDLDAVLNQEEIEALYYYLFNLKCNLSGRALWQLGTSTILKIGADSLQNCWHVAVNEPIEPFTFTFNQLMLGGGVGFNIQAENIYEIPRVKFDPKIQRVDVHDVDFIVPDNREGWVELLRQVLQRFFFTGQDFTYSTLAIRDKGARISSFGGTASGPEELVHGITAISKILSRRLGEKLTSIDCLDIMNIIGSVVVAGNVRRSAQIAIGDAWDTRFLNAKAWGRNKIPNWRVMSNNTINTNDLNELPELFWQNYEEENELGEAVSEPYGLVNLYNCRRFGRLADGLDYRPDLHVTGLNPCGEVTLESYEACNLAEIFLPNVTDEDELTEIAVLLYKVCKTISRYPFSNPRTNDVVERNHRLGIGISGFLQAGHLRSEIIYDNVYHALEEVDEQYSRQLKCSKSIKLTTVKPSGTSSLLAGVTPGGHAAFAPWYIRRIRFASDDTLLSVCEAAGYSMEPAINLDGTRNHNLMVVSFPIATPPDTICAEQLSAVAQLKQQKWLQTNWSDNSVSVTIYYKITELPAIKHYLKQQYPETIKAISFLKQSGHGFIQAPMEAISREKYLELSSKCLPIYAITESQQRELVDSLECSNGTCPVK